MLKRLTALILILITILLTGCFARQELRPQRNSDKVWVCEEIDNTYFYWDEDKKIFMGYIACGEKQMDFVLLPYSGLLVEFLHPDVLKKDEMHSEDVFISGFADYQENLMPIEITEDKLNIFNGEIDTLTFAPMDKDEYFEDKS